MVSRSELASHQVQTFVWTKMGVESGEGLAQIIQRKETERAAGRGIFWWGIGSSLGPAVRECAQQQGGALPVLFSAMLGRAKHVDSNPGSVWKWTAWENFDGRTYDVPRHVTVISRGAETKDRHYALVCFSEEPLGLRKGGKRFNPNLCRTLSGKIPGQSQVTALLQGEVGGHPDGPYEICFRAKLIEPWAVKLVRPIPIKTFDPPT